MSKKTKTEVTNTASVSSAYVPPKTIRENLDQEIESTRKRLEGLCIAKAKAETLGVLDYDLVTMNGIVNTFSPF